ncbi:class III extradiol dioxygenase subunit B-like domain-containing protein [Allokutzneria multivorans]|uniref:Class III extradiol dioxygenase subunit B-like domain-containing protein n=1 Tax=Allokutzneria multivorans TaxID=1142134 RepID=A0ABP7S5T1_9PSEU
MIVRAAVLPHPPLLVPQLVAGATEETEPLRRACLDAARWLAEATSRWSAVAVDEVGSRVIEPATRGSFAGFGVDVPVSLAELDEGEGRADPLLPLPALIAGWLREHSGAEEVRVRLVTPDLDPDQCWLVGHELVDALSGPEPVALLVLGDSSPRHGDRAPGRPDPRAGEFDDKVRDALAAADADALMDIDTELAAELGARGRSAWQVLASVAQSSGVSWRGAVDYSGAPYGVGYHVARWEPAA